MQSAELSVHDVALLVSSGLLMLVNMAEHLRALDIPWADYVSAMAGALGTF